MISLKSVRAAAAVVAAVAAIAPGAARAGAVTTFDTTLALPATGAPLGWYDGTGNPQGGFTVVTDNGIELGLRAKLRQSPLVIDSPNNVYQVPTGDQNPGHALWNYEYSIDLGPNGSNLLFSQVSVTLTVAKNGGPAQNFTFPPDNAFWGTSGKVVGDPNFLNDWGAQNSENPEFSNFPIPGFNSSEIADYTFTLSVFDLNQNLLASDTIEVDTVPEPSALSIVAIGLLGFFAVKRRRKAAAP
jgi:hypothetical protein